MSIFQFESIKCQTSKIALSLAFAGTCLAATPVAAATTYGIEIFTGSTTEQQHLFAVDNKPVSIASTPNDYGFGSGTANSDHSGTLVLTGVNNRTDGSTRVYGRIQTTFQIKSKSGAPAPADLVIPLRVIASAHVLPGYVDDLPVGINGKPNPANIPYDLAEVSVRQAGAGDCCLGTGVEGYSNRGGTIGFTPQLFSFDQWTDFKPDLDIVSVTTGQIWARYYRQSWGIVVDPIFEIAPEFASSYELVGLPIAQGGVPEPATWAMMIVGFGAIGAQMRRSQRTRVAFA